jgi:O-antigen/teichoic acid export membrane protein
MSPVEKDMAYMSQTVTSTRTPDPPFTNSTASDVPIVTPPSIWRRVRRDIVVLGAGSVGVVVAQLVFRGILVAVLVPAAYGRLSLILSIYGFVWMIGASGLPSAVARYIAMVAPADDSAIVRSAYRASAWPTAIAATLVAAASSAILHSPVAFLFGAVGLSSLVYAVITMGILRGRGQIGPAALVMPIGGIGEVALLVVLLLSGLAVTPLSAFGVFCLGNVVGLVAGIVYTVRTSPKRSRTLPLADRSSNAPSARQLLGFSMWLAAATMGIAILPLVVRLAAALNSYTVVAIVDVALVLLSIPLRMAAVIVSAVVPHATRALDKDNDSLTISGREHATIVIPFVVAAFIVFFTPVVGWLFDLLGRPQYAKSSVYLGLALLAGPARVLYGLVEGVLVARGEGKFLAFNSLSITTIASVAIVTVAAGGSMVMAFTFFVVACWAVYVCGLRRIKLISSRDAHTESARNSN